ncbi:MAG: hypothetical protein IJU04_03855 [Ruminococcus sp.]|nr:hypothetical protein [Ruminococcus sp.]
MSKKNVAIILEIIPIISALIAILPFPLGFASKLPSLLIGIAFLLAILGFVFFFIGRKLAKGNTAVFVLGLLDWVATASIIGFYVLAIFLFGL